MYFKFKDTVSETELQEVSHKQGKIAIERLNGKFDKAEVRFNFLEYVVLMLYNLVFRCTVINHR